MIDEIELKKIWQATNKDIINSIVLSTENSVDIKKIKINNFLSSMKLIKIFTILVGVLWVSIIGTLVLNLFLFALDSTNLFFLFSATIQVSLTAIALIVYVYQYIIIYQVDITYPVLKTQKRLADLKTSTLWVTRILFLQLPVWTTFYWTPSMLENGNWFLWIFQGVITTAFTIVALWLFINIKFENKNEKWFKIIFNGKEWAPLMKAMELSEQIEKYNDQSVTN